MVIHENQIIDKQEAIQVKANGDVIDQTDKLKLLGVTIDNKMTFSEHIRNLCIMSSQKIGVILRNLIPTAAKLKLYKAASLPNLTYCDMIWHFCKASDKRKLERIQERALRAIYCDKSSTYELLLQKSGLRTLQNHTLQNIAILMFKVKSYLCPPHIQDLFIRQTANYTLKNSDFILPRFNTVSYGKQSIRYLGPLIWSKLDKKLRNMSNLANFKKRISKKELGTLQGICAQITVSFDFKNCTF